MLEKNICPFLWIGQHHGPKNSVMPCCLTPADHTETIDDFDRNLEKMMNSKLHRSMRKAMLEGKWHPACSECHHIESIGMHSFRQTYLKQYLNSGNKLNDLEKITSEDGSLKKIAIQKLDFSFSNKCNLQCIACSPYYSTSHTKYDEYYADGKKLEYNSNLELLNNIDEDYIDGLKGMTFSGGEPLMEPDHLSFLNKMIEWKRADDIFLEYHTNASVVPNENFMKCWKSFRSTKLIISLDGNGKLNDFLRYPLKWSTVENNLARFNQLAKENTWLEIEIQFTVQILNLLDLRNLISFLADNFSYISPLPRLNMLASPDYLSINNISRKYKENALVMMNEIRMMIMNFLSGDYPEYIRQTVLINRKAYEKLTQSLGSSDNKIGNHPMVTHLINTRQKHSGLQYRLIAPQIFSYLNEIST